MINSIYNNFVVIAENFIKYEFKFFKIIVNCSLYVYFEMIFL